MGDGVCMDMMTIRKMVMGQMGVWKQKKVTVQSNITKADAMKTWAESVAPNGSKFAMFIRDNIDESNYANYQIISIELANGVVFNASRYINNAYAPLTYFSSGYSATAYQNDTYTIYYQ